MVELKQLKQFVAVAQTGSVSRAAEQIGIAQPPLSVSIHKLETELGAELFVRHARGVVPSAAGEAILRPVRDILTRVADLRHLITETQAGHRGRLRIGFVGSASYSILPSLIRAFRAQYPLVELELREMGSQQAVQLVETAEIEVGMIRLPMLRTGRVAVIRAMTEPMMLMVPLDHRLAEEASVQLEALRDEAFIMYDLAAVPSMRAIAMMACEAAGFTPNIVQEAAQIHSLIALVESGLGVALLPASVRRAGPERGRFLKLVQGGKPIETSVGIVVAQNEPAPVVRRFCAMFRDDDGATTPS
jgi:DNA-binding transcriptional LysR family regulator